MLRNLVSLSVPIPLLVKSLCLKNVLPGGTHLAWASLLLASTRSARASLPLCLLLPRSMDARFTPSLLLPPLWSLRLLSVCGECTSPPSTVGRSDIPALEKEKDRVGSAWTDPWYKESAYENERFCLAQLVYSFCPGTKGH